MEHHPALARSARRPRARTMPGVAAASRAAGLLAGAAGSGALTWALAHRALAVGTGAAVPGPRPAGGGWATQVGLMRVEDVVGLGAAAVGAAVAAWFCLALATSGVCLAARAGGHAWLAGERLVARTAPPVLRRAVVLSAGAGLALAGAGVPAAAAPPPPDDLGWTVSTGAGPTSTSRPAAGPAQQERAHVQPVSTATAPPDASPGGAPDTAPGGPAPDVVTVRPGDTLWGIAQRHLPPDATASDVAAAWPAWYAANAGVVGPDPDLIRPGQRLVQPVAPPPAAATTDGADR